MRLGVIKDLCSLSWGGGGGGGGGGQNRSENSFKNISDSAEFSQLVFATLDHDNDGEVIFEVSHKLHHTLVAPNNFISHEQVSFS